MTSFSEDASDFVYHKSCNGMLQNIIMHICIYVIFYFTRETILTYKLVFKQALTENNGHRSVLVCMFLDKDVKS